MHCSTCGELLRPGLLRCPTCGAATPVGMAIARPAGVRRCPRCSYQGEGIPYFRRGGNLGLLIGVTGTLLGNLLGVGGSWIADRFGLMPFPGDGFLVSHVPFDIDLPEVLMVNVIALALTAVATWYPAHIASKLDPMTAIREE